MNVSIAAVLVAACGQALGAEARPAQKATQAVHAAVLENLPFSDTRDFDDAARGLIAGFPDGVIRNDTGKVVWDLQSYTGFMAGEDAPRRCGPFLGRFIQKPISMLDDTQWDCAHQAIS